jgi:hypothetical protein
MSETMTTAGATLEKKAHFDARHAEGRNGPMEACREFWIQTVDRTFLYYRVNARSPQEALAKFADGESEYAGCTDESDEQIQKVLEDRPSIAWT